jgi:hypothetical protein
VGPGNGQYRVVGTAGLALRRSIGAVAIAVGGCGLLVPPLLWLGMSLGESMDYGLLVAWSIASVLVGGVAAAVGAWLMGWRGGSPDGP